MNKYIGCGNITKDLELKHTPTGKACCSFTIAINEGYGENKSTEYVNCVAWEKRAENLSERMGKGKKVLVEGRLKTRSYDSNGGKKYVTEVVCENIEYISPMGEGSSASKHQSKQDDDKGLFGDESDFEPLDDEQMPF